MGHSGPKAIVGKGGVERGRLVRPPHCLLRSVLTWPNQIVCMKPSLEHSGQILRGVGIGAGYFSQYHHDAWSRIPQVNIVAVADIVEERARAVAARFGIPRYYADYREMLAKERPDFVDIITRPDSHLELSTYAARQGVDVICQKPLAPTYEQAQQIVQNAKEAGVRFMVHENWRWQPWYREVKKLHASGILGDIFSISFSMRLGDGWREDAYLDRQPYFRDYPRFFMFETGVHFIDTFRFLLGEVQLVYAHLRRLNPGIAGEDCACVFLGFDNGATALLDANRYNEFDTDAPSRYTFGIMRVDGSRASLDLGHDGSIRIKPLGKPSFQHEYHHEDRGLAGDSCFNLQSHFVQAVLNGRPLESDGDDYLRTLRIVEACYDSAERKEVVRLETQDGRPTPTPASETHDIR